MTGKAATHGMVNGSFGHRGFGQIAVAGRAGDSRREMRCMAEFDMCSGRKAIDAYPGNLNLPFSVIADLLDFRFFPRQFGMAEHAFSDRWNAGAVADVCANMAIDTLHAEFHVCAMGKCNGLLCRGGERTDDEE